jgi:hypothetical protein
MCLSVRGIDFACFYDLMVWYILFLIFIIKIDQGNNM